MKFKGTIIITDPCYVIREENELTGDDWCACEYGDNMEKLGIKNYLTSDTEYGDWGCTTYKDNGDEIGEFCADAGLVSVFLLDEVREYNPNIDEWIETHPWCVTTIKNFDGDVDITHRNDEVSVVGKGNVNFFTSQTSL